MSKNAFRIGFLLRARETRQAPRRFNARIVILSSTHNKVFASRREKTGLRVYSHALTAPQIIGVREEFVANVKRAAKNPRARRVEVEDAMAVTLKKNGIVLPQAFFTVNKNFKPKLPPQKPAGDAHTPTQPQ